MNFEKNYEIVLKSLMVFDGTVYFENECFHVVCQIRSYFLGLSLLIHFNILTG